MKYIKIPTNDEIPELWLPVTDENIARAPLISVTGKYEIIDDGKPEPAPTQLDRIESQVTYTAMMTDTLIVET